jgi:lincosamide nucleotidyltransferase A/C/D/E
MVGDGTGTMGADRAVISARDAIAIIGAIEAAGIRCWVDGGWGVDALLGAEQRPHDDIDLVVPLAEADAVLAALDPHGFRCHLDERPTRLVARDGAGHQVDLHTVTFDHDGTAWQDGAGPDGGPCPYPAEGFTAGTIEGRAVGCLSAELQLAHHRRYEPGPVDLADMARLCARFSLPWPREYPDA